VPLNVSVSRNGRVIYETPINAAVEIGRRQIDEPTEPRLYLNPQGMWRLLIAELELRSIPRTLARLEPIGNNEWLLTNLHRSATIPISSSKTLAFHEFSKVEFPSQIDLPDGISLSFRLQPNQHATILNQDWHGSIRALGVSPLGEAGHEVNDLQHSFARFSMQGGSSLNSQLDLQLVLGWLEQAVSAMQCPIASPNFYAGIARAVANIIDVDRAEVILWDGQTWEFDPTRRFVHPRVDENELRPPSSTMLSQVLDSKRIVVYPTTRRDATVLNSISVRELHTAVACPILDVLEGGKQILGVLYADRILSEEWQGGKVMEAEQQLIAILATAISSSIAQRKRETLVTKYQQFFSPKVTEAISLNPALLEGEDVDVTVLFCDIRRFSKTTDSIGPKAAMAWIEDLLSELSEIVLKSDGVLVDYVGDELFAMWGAPERSIDHALKAVVAAREMMALRAQLSSRYADVIRDGVDFGIGICTGPARVGNTGSKQKFKYGPLGRTVNLGSRIQGLTKQWRVSSILDSVTANTLPTTILKRRLCRAKVVGMDGDVDLYELLPDDSSVHAELVSEYEKALQLFESGVQIREAARAFGELVQRFPNDGPSLVMLVRAVSELEEPSQPFSPVWTAKTK
jgi:adenylate cyclase